MDKASKKLALAIIRDILASTPPKYWISGDTCVYDLVDKTYAVYWDMDGPDHPDKTVILQIQEIER